MDAPPAIFTQEAYLTRDLRGGGASYF